MKRLKLLGMIAVLAALLAAVVLYASPYAPAVGPCIDIEEMWAIEDAREYVEGALITRLEMNGVPLAYSEAENMFYCPIGLDHEEWPRIHLTAPGAKGVRLLFSDDYTYDWCYDAVKEGYAYEIMAYSDTQYAYFYIVFTGLPIVSLTTQEMITAEDTAAAFAFGVPGGQGFESPARVHLRGDRSLEWKPKGGYKVEFTRGMQGGKVVREVEGLCMTDEILLLPIAIDNTMMRDKLSWDMVGLAIPEEEGFGGLPSQYVELFINGSYEGAYLMLKPFDNAAEMRKAGERSAYSDSLYRIAMMEMAKERPILQDPTSGGIGYELRHTPHTAHPFAALESYMDLLTETDDAAFEEKALACLNLDSLLRYELIMQAGAMVDNAYNNLYVWAHQTQSGVKYRFAFWDMDLTWGLYAGELGDRWVDWPIADRVIALDVGGAKARIGEIWEALKARGFTLDTVERLVEQYTHELGDSGAFMRDAYRWGKGHFYPDGYEIVNFASTRFVMIDEWIASLTQ